MRTDKFTFFWNGPFSNWYPSEFSLEGIRFTHMEQYMMWKKAMLFKDGETAMMILSAKHPKEQKGLGRQVRNFDRDKWNAECKKIVYDGCMAKFTQNKTLKQELLETGNTELVEASHTDKIWGIGLLQTDPLALDKTNWKGTNWLGEILTQVRDDIKKNNEKNHGDSKP